MHDDNTTEVLGFVPLGQVASKRKLCLVVVSGSEKGAVYPLEVGSFTLGRSPQHADFVVTGRGLSRAHARVTVESDEQIFVEDLGSTNGMFVNGDRVERHPLKPGDTLALGPDLSLRLDAPDQGVQELLREMHRGATQDALTGLLNRRSFMERLEAEEAALTRHSHSSCLAILDVDHFKQVNDVYGHPAGDAVLVEVARRMTERVRHEDVLARWGGEEFVVLLRQTDLEGGAVLLERLRCQIADLPFEVPTSRGGQSIQVTLSAGITLMTPGTSLDKLMEQADGALYQAKRNGRNRVEVA